MYAPMSGNLRDAQTVVVETTPRLYWALASPCSARVVE